jgi:hypothetical protein
MPQAAGIPEIRGQRQAPGTNVTGTRSPVTPVTSAIRAAQGRTTPSQQPVTPTRSRDGSVTGWCGPTLPDSETVSATLLLMAPPMINKFYAMDLAPGRSLVEYLVGEGVRVFMVS